jgi:hypothetical protein
MDQSLAPFSVTVITGQFEKENKLGVSMDFFLCFIGLQIGLIFFIFPIIKKRLDPLIKQKLADLSKAYGGKILEGGLISAPRLVFELDGINISVTQIITGSGRHQRKPVWSISSKLPSQKSGYAGPYLQIIPKMNFNIDLRFTIKSKDLAFDNQFNIYAGNLNSSQVLSLLSEELKNELKIINQKIDEFCLNVRADFVEINVPFLRIQEGTELEILIPCILKLAKQQMRNNSLAV